MSEEALKQLLELNQMLKLKHEEEVNKLLKEMKADHDSLVRHYENFINSRCLQAVTTRALAWGTRVLGTINMDSRWERMMRLLEEVMELSQAEGIPVTDVSRLLEYVYKRPPGVMEQEVGGVMVSLLLWASSARVDLEVQLLTEVGRAETADAEKVRKKQKEKWTLGVGMEPHV